MLYIAQVAKYFEASFLLFISELQTSLASDSQLNMCKNQEARPIVQPSE